MVVARVLLKATRYSQDLSRNPTSVGLRGSWKETPSITYRHPLRRLLVESCPKPHPTIIITWYPRRAGVCAPPSRLLARTRRELVPHGSPVVPIIRMDTRGEVQMVDMRTRPERRIPHMPLPSEEPSRLRSFLRGQL